MTYRDFYTAVAQANVSAELTEFAENAIKKLDEKNDKKKEYTSPKQKENARFKETMLEEMTKNAGKVYTARILADLYETNTQTVSALITQMVKAGQIEKIEKWKDTKGNRVNGYRVKVEDETE